MSATENNKPYKHIILYHAVTFLPTIKNGDSTVVSSYDRTGKYVPPTLQEVIEAWAQHQGIPVPEDFRFDVYSLADLEKELDTQREHSDIGSTAYQLEQAFENGMEDKRIIIHTANAQGFGLATFPDPEIKRILSKYCVEMHGTAILDQIK